jgi:hypothetical protein
MNGRNSVLAEWELEFNREEPEMGWNGNVATCNPGTTSIEFQLSVHKRVNWFRRMAGVPEVAYRAELHSQQQSGALIGSANGKLDHYPEKSSRCWTAEGFTSTSTSNLYLGKAGIHAVNGYIWDPGDNNKRVGHRWWLLHPGLQSVSTGDIPSIWTNETFQLSANAINITNVDWNRISSRDRFVTWPPAGSVPSNVIYPRWSITSYAGEDLSNAIVTITGPLGQVAVSYEHRDRESLVFVPSGFEKAPLSRLTTGTYNVTVTNLSNGPTNSFSYRIDLFDGNLSPKILGVNAGSGAKKCFTPGTVLATIDSYDPDDSGPFEISLVKGLGSEDNRFFKISQMVRRAESTDRIVIARKLDNRRQKYSVRLRISDKRGKWSESQHLIEVLVDKNQCNKRSR